MSFDPALYREYFSERPDEYVGSLNLERIPKHIAIIMDGNGRWAQARGLSRAFGHAAGVESLKEVITASVRMGVQVLTIYAFSTENWNRPPAEVDTLMGLFASTLIEELPLLHREHVRLRYLGDMTRLPDETRKTFERGLDETAANDGMVLAVAVNYGSRKELARAARRLAERAVAGEVSPDQIDERMFESELYTFGLPDPELLIRTSGEKRLSNFMLWQAAYSEFVFVDVLWPDFTRWDLFDAILEYQSRSRRFGGLTGGAANV